MRAPRGSARRISGRRGSRNPGPGIAAGPSSSNRRRLLRPCPASSTRTSMCAGGIRSLHTSRRGPRCLPPHRGRAGTTAKRQGFAGRASSSPRIRRWTAKACWTCLIPPENDSPSKRSTWRTCGGRRRIRSSKPPSRRHTEASRSESCWTAAGRRSKRTPGRTMRSSRASTDARRTRACPSRCGSWNRAGRSSGCTTRASSWTAGSCSCRA